MCMELEGSLLDVHNMMKVLEFNAIVSARRATAAEAIAEQRTANNHNLQLQITAVQNTLDAERLAAQQAIRAKDAECSLS
jgi:hypothetical protein